jgi:prepilin-type N-terminal cleavage/methylation domain-containing protein
MRSGRGARWRASNGFTLIELLVVIAVIGIIAALAAGRMMRAKMASHEASAIGSLRAINSGQLTYSASCGGSGFAATLEDLANMPNGTDAPFISPDLAVTGVQKSGYFINLGPDTGATTVLVASQTCNQSVNDTISSYFADAEPVTYNGTGRRTFGTDRRGGIFYRTDGIAVAAGMAGALPID